MRGKANRPKSGDEHGVIAIDRDFFNRLIDGSKSARNLRAVCVSQLLGECNEVFLLGNHVIGHSAVALPTIGTPIFFVRARDHVAPPAIVADSTTGDVIDDDSVANSEARQPGPASTI